MKHNICKLINSIWLPEIQNVAKIEQIEQNERKNVV